MLQQKYSQFIQPCRLLKTCKRVAEWDSIPTKKGAQSLAPLPFSGYQKLSWLSSAAWVLQRLLAWPLLILGQA
jgi:hypothetical protein